MTTQTIGLMTLALGWRGPFSHASRRRPDRHPAAVAAGQGADAWKMTIERGFCTGRRLHAWLEALDHDLAKASVAKKTTLDRYFGKPITSCVPIPTDAIEMRPRGPRITGAAEIARTALASILANSGQTVVRDGIPTGVPTVTVEAWRAEAYRFGISTGDADAQRKAFQRATEKLLGARVAVIRDGLAWLP
jgi:hypothetical protein